MTIAQKFHFIRNHSWWFSTLILVVIITAYVIPQIFSSSILLEGILIFLSILSIGYALFFSFKYWNGTLFKVDILFLIKNINLMSIFIFIISVMVFTFINANIDDTMLYNYLEKSEGDYIVSEGSKYIKTITNVEYKFIVHYRNLFLLSLSFVMFSAAQLFMPKRQKEKIQFKK